MQESVSFDPSQMVITSGATPAMEILSFCVADPGNAFLVPSPYYPGYVCLPCSQVLLYPWFGLQSEVLTLFV